MAQVESILYQDEYIIMNGREVFKFAVRQMGESSINVLEKAGLVKEDVDFFIPHQANIRIMEASRQRLELPVEKMSKTVHKYGNTSAASIPISLVEELEAGKIKDDDVIVMVGFGGGLTWGAICYTLGKIRSIYIEFIYMNINSNIFEKRRCKNGKDAG